MSDPSRIVAGPGVLVADLFVGGPSRAAVDLVREHSWVTLVASEPLLADAEAAVADLGDADLATDWRAKLSCVATIVEHPPGDHPAIACARAGNAAQVLSLDEGIASAAAGAAIRRDAGVETSVKRPGAFLRVFDAASLYDAVVGGEYPGPDRDPRA